MSELFIGLMSGTSMDAIDSVLVDFKFSPLKLITTHSEPIPALLKQSLHALCQPGDNEIERMGELDIQLGMLFAKACNMVVEKSGIKKEKIQAIGSHGQTIRHKPNSTYAFTLQIGDPNIIAEKTGITVVADFRRRDIAVGGQGAPLTPIFHNFAFHDKKYNRIIVNIGGIANVTFLPANNKKAIIGFDTGPGNALLDAWIKANKNKAYDEYGDWAASGNTNNELLKILLADGYFRQPPPKSTGIEYFNLNWLKPKLPNEIAPEDVQATLVELTALSILREINKYTTEQSQILICGGGIRNQYLIKRLETLQTKHSIHSTTEFGIDPTWVEAIAFAWLAKQTLNKKQVDLRTITGAKKNVILGGIYPSGPTHESRTSLN